MSAPVPSSEVFDRARRLLADRRPGLAQAVLSGLDPQQLGETGRRILELMQKQAAAEALESNLPSSATLLGADMAEPLAGIAIVSACMNREGNLLKVLPSWLDSPVDEILIVDWSSRQALWPQLAQWSGDPRLRVVRVEDEPRWVLTHAFNVGLRLARHERIYKLDADIELQPDFFEKNQFERGEFVRGFWRAAVNAGQDDQRYVNGSFGAFKDDLRAIGYYDERIQTYGWDDSDLYRRLAGALGLAGRQLAYGSLRHLHQEEAQRTESQSLWSDSFLGRFSPTEYEIQVNRFHISCLPEWGVYYEAQDYALKCSDQRLCSACRTSEPPVANEGERRLGQTLAARNMATWCQDELHAFGLKTASSLDFSWFLAQLQVAGQSARFVKSLSSGTGVHLFRGSSNAFREAIRHTLAQLAPHRGGVEPAIIVVEGDGFCPEQRDSRDEGVVLASAAIMDELERVLAPAAADDLASLEGIVGGLTKPCTVWRIDAGTLAASATRTATRLSAGLCFELEPLAEPVRGTWFVSSVYDENNLLRLTEYLACLVLNGRAFERLTLFCETNNGLFARAVQRLVSEGWLPAGRLLLRPFDGRPNFDELFAAQAQMPAETLLVVANADVFLDGSLARLARELPSDLVCAISRRDVSPDGRAAHLIRLENGCPNMFSADVWVVRTPFAPDFFLDYPIGSYHCDSFINYQVSLSSRYRPANPCLDVRVFHVHDERFNSSKAKALRDKELIGAREIAESQRNGGANPVRAMPWCRLGDVDLLGSRDIVMTWRPRAVVIDRSRGAVTLTDLLLANALAQAMRPHWDVVVVLRASTADAGGAVLRLAAYMKAHFRLGLLALDLGEVPTVDGNPGAQPLFLDGGELAQSLVEGGLQGLQEHVRQRTGWADSDAVDPSGATVLAALDDHQAYPLWRALTEHQPGFMEPLTNWLQSIGPESAEGRLLHALLQDLCTLPQAPTIGGERPAVSFVTSMVRGGVFVPGYLANVLAAAEEVDGEVLLFDANLDDHDAPAVEAFLRQHEPARRRIRWQRLDRDPGLYACWRLAIEQARAPFITNANLDDRRSPGHTRRIVELLQTRPDLAAASGRISAVRDRAEGGWFDLLPSERWFEDIQPGDFGTEGLFLVDEDGVVRSRNLLHCMPVWRHDLHERFGWFDEDRYGTSADWAFWLTVARGGGRFAFMPQARGRYFVNPNSHNRRHDADGAKERRIIAELIGVQQARAIKQ